MLAQDGVFVQFTYGPLSPVPRVITRSLELVKDRSAWVLRNVPPASVWRYSRAQPNLAETATPHIAAGTLPPEAANGHRAVEPVQIAE